MCQANHLNAERTYLCNAAGTNLDQGNIFLPAILGQLAAQQCQREGASIDRAPKLRPHIGNGTKMIFMAVRQNKPGKLITSLLDEADVRQHDINSRHAVIRE